MKIKGMAVALLSSMLLLAGCQTTTRSTGSGNNGTTSAVSTSRVANKQYSGTHKGNGTNTGPTYQYELNFKKDGTFWQAITSSNGYAARYIERGTYQYNNSTKTITLNIKQVTETSYASDADLQAKANPLTLNRRSSTGQNSQTALTKAEDHPIKIKNQGSYLVGSVNQVKLYPTKHAATSYQSLVSQSQKAYNSTAAVINQESFEAKLGTSRIWISFNGDGTWQCRIIDGTHRWDIYDQGTWQITKGKLFLTPTGKIREYTIVGDTTNPTKYSGVTSNSSRVTDNFTWKIEHDGLRITSKQDSDLTAVMSNIKTTTAQSYTIAQQDLAKSDSDTEQTVDPFGSQAAYLKWVQSNLITSGWRAVDLATKDVSHYEQTFKRSYPSINPLYLSTEETTNSDTSSKDKIIIFGSDGNVYQESDGTWVISSKYTALVPMVSDSTTTLPNYPFHSDREFGEWVINHGTLQDKSYSELNFKFQAKMNKSIASEKTVEVSDNGESTPRKIPNVYCATIRSSVELGMTIQTYVDDKGTVYDIGNRGGYPHPNKKLTSMLKNEINE